LQQTAGGYYGVDLDLEFVTADRITASGTARLAGVVDVNLLDPLTKAAKAQTGTHDHVIVSGAAGAVQEDPELRAPQTAVSTYSLETRGGNEIVLRNVVDYAPGTLDTKNQRAVGGAVNRIQFDQRSPRFAPIATSLFFVPNSKMLGAIYDSLSGSATSGTQQTSFMAQDFFLSLVDRQTEAWHTGDASPNSVTLGGNRVLSYASRRAPTGTMDGAPQLSAHNGGLPRTLRVWGSGFGGAYNYKGAPAIGSVASEHSGVAWRSASITRSRRTCSSVPPSAEAPTRSKLQTARRAAASMLCTPRSTARTSTTRST
jgi:uncharacterized protein with beta-barrel porin domain